MAEVVRQADTGVEHQHGGEDLENEGPVPGPDVAYDEASGRQRQDGEGGEIGRFVDHGVPHAGWDGDELRPFAARALTKDAAQPEKNEHR